MDQTNVRLNVSETQDRAQTEVPGRGGRGHGIARRTQAIRTSSGTLGRVVAHTISSCCERALAIMKKSTAG